MGKYNVVIFGGGGVLQHVISVSAEMALVDISRFPYTPYVVRTI